MPLRILQPAQGTTTQAQPTQQSFRQLDQGQSVTPKPVSTQPQSQSTTSPLDIMSKLRSTFSSAKNKLSGSMPSSTGPKLEDTMKTKEGKEAARQLEYGQVFKTREEGEKAMAEAGVMQQAISAPKDQYDFFDPEAQQVNIEAEQALEKQKKGVDILEKIGKGEDVADEEFYSLFNPEAAEYVKELSRKGFENKEAKDNFMKQVVAFMASYGASTATNALLTKMFPTLGKGATFLSRLGGKMTTGGLQGLAGETAYTAVTEQRLPTAGEAATATAFGAVLEPIVGYKEVIKGPEQQVDEAISTIKKATGEITQASTEDQLKKATKGLKLLKGKNINTYNQLTKTADDSIGLLARESDDLLKRDTKKYLIDQLDTTVKVGDEVVNQNFVDDALEQLDELYRKNKELEKLAKIQQYKKKLAEQGLQLQELNNIARSYGSDMPNAFSKVTGEPLTSTSKIASERTRKGIKEVIKTKLPSDIKNKFNLLDDNMSSLFTVKDLSKKMESKTLKAMNKLKEQGLVEKLTKLVGTTIDKASLGAVKGFTSGILPNYLQTGSYSAIELEKKLASNLKILEEMDEILNVIGKTPSKKQLNELIKRITILMSTNEVEK